jgi:hypothetical protein
MERPYAIRAMTRVEVGLAVDWAAAEGWNPGLRDADCFHAADDGGFLVGMLGDEAVATISVVKYGETFGFLGFYIVKPGHRGHGHGLAIWNAGLERLKGRAIGLDGVVAQQDNYRRSGFAFAYNNVRHEGTRRGGARADAAIVDLATLPFAQVAAYDAPFFPADRTRFLACWIRQGRALGYVRDGPPRGLRRDPPVPRGFQDRPALRRRRAHRRGALHRPAVGPARGHAGVPRHAGAEQRSGEPRAAARHEARLRDGTHVLRRGAATAPRAPLRGDDLRAGLKSKKGSDYFSGLKGVRLLFRRMTPSSEKVI